MDAAGVSGGSSSPTVRRRGRRPAASRSRDAPTADFKGARVVVNIVAEEGRDDGAHERA